MIVMSRRGQDKSFIYWLHFFILFIIFAVFVLLPVYVRAGAGRMTKDKLGEPQDRIWTETEILKPCLTQQAGNMIDTRYPWVNSNTLSSPDDFKFGFVRQSAPDTVPQFTTGHIPQRMSANLGITQKINLHIVNKPKFT